MEGEYPERRSAVALRDSRFWSSFLAAMFSEFVTEYHEMAEHCLAFAAACLARRS
jgi:hypothetical protein